MATEKEIHSLMERAIINLADSKAEVPVSLLECRIKGIPIILPSTKAIDIVEYVTRSKKQEAEAFADLLECATEHMPIHWTQFDVGIILDHAIRSKNQDLAKKAINYGILADVPLHTMTDLHYPLLLLLLLAAPKKETRGRKKSLVPGTSNWFMNMACQIRADMDNKSFDATWQDRCKKTRPKIEAVGLPNCVFLLKWGISRKDRTALYAARTFMLTDEILDSYNPVNE